MDIFQAPKLAPPGAGIPRIEGLFLRYIYFPHKLRQSSWADNLDKLQRETRNILNICEKLTEQEFQTRILVERLKGMEDSSRFWSVALTVQHLMITMKGMSFVAAELAQDRPYTSTVGTADVKPKQEDVKVKAEMLQNFHKQSDEVVNKLKLFQEAHSSQYRADHPWFGQITSEGWVWVLAQHQALHRNQIQLIVEHL